MNPCRRYHFLFVLALLICVASAALAVPATIHRQVLLPDGSPAVGATVTLRVIDWAKSVEGERTLVGIKQELTTTTDKGGYFTIDFDYAWKWQDWLFSPAYLMVDADKCDLLISNMGGWMEGRDVVGPVKLVPNKGITGTVVDAKGAPIPGENVEAAELSAAPISKFPLNVAYARAVTPSLIVKTDNDGNYTLRGISLEDTKTIGAGMPFVKDLPLVTKTDGLSIAITATGMLGGVANGGTTVLADNPITPIIAGPVSAIAGHVVDPVTNQPIAGATVRLACMPDDGALMVRPSTTDASGAFQFTGAPPSSEYAVHATVTGCTDGWTVVDGDGKQLLPAKDYADVVVYSRPLVPIAGHVVDSLDGKPEISNASVIFTFDEPLAKAAPQDGMRIPWPWMADVEAAPDGSFSTLAPAGRLSARVVGINFEGNQSVKVLGDPKSPGNKDIEIDADRKPGFLVSVKAESKGFIPTNYAIEFKPGSGNGTWKRIIAGQQMYRFFPTANWGDKASVRIVSGMFRGPSVEIVGWQDIVADIRTMPTIEIPIPVPAAPTTPAAAPTATASK